MSAVGPILNVGIVGGIAGVGTVMEKSTAVGAVVVIPV